MTEIIDRMKPGEWESLLLPDKEDDPDWREPSPFEAEIEPDSCDDESEETRLAELVSENSEAG